MLEQGFVLCVEQAEKENSISLVFKANALKRKSEEKKEDVASWREHCRSCKRKRRN